MQAMRYNLARSDERKRQPCAARHTKGQADSCGIALCGLTCTSWEHMRNRPARSHLGRGGLQVGVTQICGGKWMKKAQGWAVSCLLGSVLLAIAPTALAQVDGETPPPAAQGQTPPAAAGGPRQQRPPAPGSFSAPLAHGEVKNYRPVTNEMLLNPSPDDWLQFSRTYDAWRYSPLKQINKRNVGELREAWVRGLPAGTTETIPIVHDGVMYVITPGGGVDAIDAVNGDAIWQYRRQYKNPTLGTSERTKAIAIYNDLVYFTAPDGYVVAIDAKNGKERWATYKTDTQNTSGAIVVDGKVISGGTCGRGRDSCFIEADDA